MRKNLTATLKGIIFLFVALLVFLSLFSYTPQDLSFVAYPPLKTTHNLIGIVGAYISFILFFCFGYASYFLCFYFLGLALERFKVLRFAGLARNRWVIFFSSPLFLIFLSSFIGLFYNSISARLHLYPGGLGGNFLASFLKKYLGFSGAFIALLLLLSINAVLLFGFFFLDIFPFFRRLPLKMFSLFRIILTPLSFLKRKKKIKLESGVSKEGIKLKRQEPREREAQTPIKPEIKVYAPQVSAVSKREPSLKDTPSIEPETILRKEQVNSEEIKKKLEVLERNRTRFDPKTYKLPSLSILKVPPALNYREVKEDIEESIKNLEETLLDFDVQAKVVSVQKGPVVTMYELQPQAGVKINKISALADDIALAMKSSSVRVVAPLPARGTVGVEVPNEKKHLVYLREVLEERAFIQSSSKLTLAIGKDVSGNPVVADLKEMPHLLIAGTTGSGKTVCVNSIICSILFKAKPDEVKFILIDPKMVELAHFAGIPHLLHAIIFEAKKAFAALNWAVEEMERRYHLLAEEGVRNIDMYNKIEKRMPYIVIVVDELADLMVVAKESIEVAIQRLAQLSRAVGIHLILATQRPSVDVITGVIKANFPARISFKVSSKVDSRTVLDVMGAEKLLGKGDLLFLKPGAVRMIRAQGCFIDDEDIESLTGFVRSQGGPVYEEDILEADKKNNLNVEEDELFEEAVKTIILARQASASILQRRLRVGYTRAARLLDLMEKAGIVGPFCGSKAREILVDPEGYAKEKGWV